MTTWQDDPIISSDEAARTVLNLAVPQDPNAASEVLRLRRRYPGPTQVLKAELPAFKNAATADDAAKILANAPTLAKTYLSDPIVAEATHDDIPALSSIERAVREFVNPFKHTANRYETPQPTGTMAPWQYARNVRHAMETYNVDADTARSLVLGVPGASFAEPGKGKIEVPATVGNIARGIAVTALEAFVGGDAGLSRMFAEWRGDAADAATFAARQAESNAQVKAVTPDIDNWFWRDVYGGGVSTAQNLPGILVGGLLAGAGLPVAVASAVPLTAMFSSSAGEAYGRFRGRGGQVGESSVGAITTGGLEVLTELPVVASTLRLFGRTGAGEFLKGTITKELVGEIVNTVASDAVDTAIANPTATWQQYLEDLPVNIRDTVVQTLTQSLLMGGASHALSKTVTRKQATDYEVAKAIVVEQQLSRMLALASTSKTRERDPKTFGDLAQTMAEQTEGAPTEVRFDARTLTEVLNQEDLRLLPTVKAQLDAGVVAGDEVVVPIGELLANVAGTPTEKKLLEHARTGDNELSAFEAKEAQKQAEEFLQRDYEQVVQEIGNDVAVMQSTAAVHKTLLDQLLATELYTKDASDAMATVAAQMFTVLGHRLGMTAEEVYAKYPLKIVNSRTGENGPGFTKQSPHAITVEGYHYSTEARPMISTRAFGAGLQGSGREQYQNATDVRRRSRAYFYVDKGTGITPEAGVGGVGHRTQLTNIYDSNSDPLRLRRGDQAAFETAVLDAGFSGYLDRMSGDQPGHVVMLGDQQIPVQPLGPLGKTKGQVVPPATKRPAFGRDVVVDALRENTALPAGSLTPQRWSEVLKAVMPAEHAQLEAAGVFAPGESMYKSELLNKFEAATEAPVYEQGARPIRQEVADASSVENARAIAQSQKWETNRDFKLALQRAVLKAANTIDLTKDTPEVRAYLVRQILAEARAAIVSAEKAGQASAIGWYDDKVTTAIEVLAAIHPELKTDKESRFAFTWALAITSNGVKVDKNFEIAERAYTHWKANGKQFPTTGIGVGTSATQIHNGLALYNRMVKAWGFDKFSTFATTLQRNRDVKAQFGRAVSGEGMDAMVYGAGVVGPKIGNGFFMNLHGVFSQLTMDRWWVRMWGRLTGNLVEVDRAEIKRSGEELTGLIERIKADSAALKAFEDAIQPKRAKQRVKLSTSALRATAEAIVAATAKGPVRDALAKVLPATPELQAEMAGLRSSFKPDEFVSLGDEIRKAAKNYLHKRDGQIESPQGSKQRDMMRAVADSVQAELLKDYPDLTTADFQAVMWYPEKTLYDTAAAADGRNDEGYNDDEAPDYANAAIKLARNQGISDTDINAAVERARADVAARKLAKRSGRGAGNVPAASGPGPGDATPADFTDRERLSGILYKDNWAILTAADPGAKTQSAEENAAAMERLRADLTARGLAFTEIVGKYGETQPGVIVFGIDEAQAVEIGRAYGQESVLTKKGLIYANGDVVPATGQVNIFDTPPADFYTHIPGTSIYFSVDLNFEAKHSAKVERKLQALEQIVNRGLVDDARRALATAEKPKAEELLTPEQRAEADAVVVPLLERAGQAHGELSDTIKAIAQAVGLQARIPGLKGLERSSEKLVLEYPRLPDGSLDPDALQDLVRGTIVVADQAGVEAAAAMVRERYEVLREKDKFTSPTPSGYRDYLLNVRMPNGAIAEIQINIPSMIVAKSIAHELYVVERALPEGADGKWRLQSLQRLIYSEAFAAPREAAQRAMSAASAGVALASNGLEGNGLVGSSANTSEPSASLSTGAPSTSNSLASDGTSNMGTSSDGPILAQAETLNQAKDPRGTFNPGSMTIALLKRADLSTFHHEMAHFYLEVLTDVASQPGAPADVVADMDVLMKWFGVKDLAAWRAMSLEERRANHEKFAEHYELYLFEGKAPTLALRDLFRRFSAWMKNVYKSVQAFMLGRGATLTPEVRRVYDHMLATEAQIKEAEEADRFEPLFKAAAEAGMDPKQWAEYQRLLADAQDTAIEELQKKGLADMKWLTRAVTAARRSVDKAVAAAQKAVHDEVAAEVNAMPVYAAQRALEERRQPTEADRDALKDWRDRREAAEERAREKLKAELLAAPEAEGLIGIQRGQYMAKNKRMLDNAVEREVLMWEREHPKPTRQYDPADLQLVADQFGFESPEQMLREFMEAQPAKVVIEGMTDQRMLERHGDLATEAGVQRATLEAVHNEARARFIATELSVMTKARSPIAQTIKAAKLFAAEMIGRKRVRDLYPSRHERAAAKAAGMATAANKAGDAQAAIQAKQEQLMHFHLAKAAAQAQDDVQRMVEHMRKLGDSKAIAQDYKDQIEKLLEGIELRPRTLRELDRRASLAEWVAEQEAQGLEPTIPQHLLDGSRLTNYKEMTVRELRGLYDTVRQIEHLGKLKKKLLLSKDKREFQAIVAEMTASIERHADAHGRKAKTNRSATTPGGRALEKLRAFSAAHVKAAMLVRELDGGEDGGPVWEHLIRIANEQADWETKRRAKATQELTAMLKPWLDKGKINRKQHFASINRSLTRQEVLAIALNTGNESNLQRLLGGEGWQLSQLEPVLDTLTKEDWALVQDIWDYFETYRPEIGAKQKRVYGVEPEWIPAGSPVTQARALRGGYYPIKYDPRANAKAESFDMAEEAKRLMNSAHNAATTRRSFTKARAEKVEGRPLVYDLRGLYTGIDDVIHDLAWHEWLIDSNRLLRALDDVIRDRYGADAVRQLQSWRVAIAEGDTKSQHAIDSGIGLARQFVSIAGLGYNVMSAALQPVGITNSWARVGGRWVAPAVTRYIAHPIEMTREAEARSDFMASRARTRFRDLNELRNRVQGEAGMIAKTRDNAFWLMQQFQRMVDVPTWHAAYAKALAGGSSEERAAALADQAVIDSQGSGLTKDLAAIERGGPLPKLFTAFYSFMNTSYNLLRLSGRVDGIGDKLATIVLVGVMPAVLTSLLRAAFTPGDSGDDDWKKIARKLAAEELSYLMGMMVGLREFTEAGKTMLHLADQQHDYAGPTGLRVINDVYRFVQQAHQGEFDDAFRKAAVNLVGDITGLPSAQINRSVTGFNALNEGKTSNPLALLFGYQEPK